MANSSSFPEADVNKELHPGRNNVHVEVDPISSDIAIAKAIQVKEEIERKKKQKEKRDAIESLKRTVLISVIVAAVAGAAFAVAKKLREK